MSELVQSVLFWIRRNLAWSNSRQSWEERLGVLVLVLGAVLLWRYSKGLELGQKLVVWVAWLAALAFVLRRGWLKLFGPVLFYDMVRVGRRSRYFLVRTAYVVFLFLMMTYVYSTWSWRLESRQLASEVMSEFAESFFYTFMGVQFLVLLVLTPGYVAGCIADEKDRKTLEFLLATDLRNREIVLGKLISRLANLLMIVLAGLPVLAFMQFFGGVDPDVLLASFASQAATVFSMAGLSILLSVYSRRPRDAIALTFLTLLAYPTLALSFYGMAAGMGWAAWSFTLPSWLGGGPITAGDFFAAVNAGNPIYALITYQAQTRGGFGGGNPAADVIAELYRNYMIFHLAVGMICSAWAVARLRAIALKETYARAAKLPALAVHRPAVGEDGMMWKEVFVETNWKMHWLGRSLMVLLIGASFLPAGIILWSHLERTRQFDFLAEEMNVWIRSVGTIVACLIILGVTVRGASSVGSERDRQTMDALLTTPLTTGHILWTKWVGSVLSMRWPLLWLYLIWLVGIATGGLHVIAVPLLTLAMLVYAGVFALVGLWFSIVSKTTGRATLWSLLTAVFIGGTHWCFWSMCCFAPWMMGGRGMDSRHVGLFMAGQTPPFVLGFLAFSTKEVGKGSNYVDNWWGETIFFCLFGLACWTVAALFVANLAGVRFKQITGRDEYLRSDGARRSLDQGLAISERQISDVRIIRQEDRIVRQDPGEP